MAYDDERSPCPLSPETWVHLRSLVPAVPPLPLPTTDPLRRPIVRHGRNELHHQPRHEEIPPERLLLLDISRGEVGTLQRLAGWGDRRAAGCAGEKLGGRQR